MSSGKRDKKNRNGNIISKSRYNPRNNIRQEKIKYDRIDTDDPNDNNHLVIKDSIERNKYVLDSVNMWINNADSKIGLAFAILSAILALIVFVTEDWLSKIEHTKNDNTLMYFFYSFVVLSVVFFLLSVIFYFLCIIPSAPVSTYASNGSRCSVTVVTKLLIFISLLWSSIDLVYEDSEVEGVGIFLLSTTSQTY